MGISLSLETITICAVVMFVASAVQGTLGMGGALIAAPIFGYLVPELLPAPLIINGALITLAVFLRERSRTLWSTMRLILPSAIVGIVIGGLLLSHISAQTYAILIGLAVIMAAILVMGGWQIALNSSNAIVAGGLCGFMHATVSLPGPPIMLLFRNQPADVFRPTLAAYLFLTSIFSLVTLFAVGRLGGAEVGLAALILPGTILGYLVSSLLIPRINSASIRLAVLVFAMLAGVALILGGMN